MTSRLVVCGLAVLTVLASIAELVLASWVLHSLYKLHDAINYGYGGMEQSSSDPFVPMQQNVSFSKPWVFEQTAGVWAIPGCEVAAGVLAFALGLVLCTSLITLSPSRKRNARHASSSLKSHRVTAVFSLSLALAIIALFIYVFATSENSINNTKLNIDGPNGGEGWDAPPTWEVWTCAVSSLLDEFPSVPAARSEWHKMCRLTVYLHNLPILQQCANHVLKITDRCEVRSATHFHLDDPCDSRTRLLSTQRLVRCN